MQKFVYNIFVSRSTVILYRFWDLLCVPLSRDDELLVSEKDRIEAVLAQLSSYSDLASLTVKIIHIVDGIQNN